MEEIYTEETTPIKMSLLEKMNVKYFLMIERAQRS